MFARILSATGIFMMGSFIVGLAYSIHQLPFYLIVFATLAMMIYDWRRRW